MPSGFVTPAGGGIPNPITSPLDIATTNPNVAPFVITLPTGFAAGSGVAYKIVDEHGLTLVEQDADGSLTILSAAGEQASIAYFSADFTGAVTMTPGLTGAADALVRVLAPTGRAAEVNVNDIHRLLSSGLGFFGHAPAAQQTGVAVTAAGIHAALVAYGIITA